ncbi:hypothetical protein DFS33DRAFT_181166 [Desarmillaria ectypa]|nr:hypothetical protein DFS33DRAFT_181166 [Desarmillaria ectypa]
MASETSQFEVSEAETQFVPKSDDEDTLWTVLEILQEKGKRYKVKWAGIDPETKKSWPPSWVPKHDCTPDLVMEWKRKKLSKTRRNSSKSFRGGSAISRVSKSDTLSKTSNASSSTTVPYKSRQTVSKNETDYDSPPTAGPSKPRQTLTKKSQPLPEPEFESEESDTNLIQRSYHTPQKRKRVSSDSEDLPDAATLVRSSPKKRKLNESPHRNGSRQNSNSARGSMGPSRKSKSITADLIGNGTESGRGRAASAVSSGGRKSPSILEDDAGGSAGPSKVSNRGSVGSSKHATSRGPTALNGSRRSSLESISRASSQPPPIEEEIPADAPYVEPPSSPPVTLSTKRPDPIYRNLSPSSSLRLKEWEDDLALIDKEKEEAATAAIAALSIPGRDEMPPPSSSLHDQHSQLSPGNDSYRKGVVPATDTESSNNTQSQSQQIASQESNQTLQRTTSLVKSMKGKSPSKANINEKPKGPIPQISPSTFTPFLRPQTVGEDGEIPSSIEQFSSPVRPSGEEITMRASVSEDSHDGQLHDRGAQLAEEARTKLKGPTIKKLSLLDIQRQYKEREKKERAKAKGKGRAQEQEKVQAIEYPNSNENTRTDADDEADDDGARPNDEDTRALLRREEEESSQDILAELENAQVGPKPVDEPPIVPQVVDVPMQIDEVTVSSIESVYSFLALTGFPGFNVPYGVR